MIRALFKGLFGLFATLGIAGVFAFYGACLAMFVGWFGNVAQLILLALNASTFAAITFTPTLALKIVGVFVGPLGGVMGLIGFF